MNRNNLNISETEGRCRDDNTKNGISIEGASADDVGVTSTAGKRKNSESLGNDGRSNIETDADDCNSKRKKSENDENVSEVSNNSVAAMQPTIIKKEPKDGDAFTSSDAEVATVAIKFEPIEMDVTNDNNTEAVASGSNCLPTSIKKEYIGSSSTSSTAQVVKTEPEDSLQSVAVTSNNPTNTTQVVKAEPADGLQSVAVTSNNPINTTQLHTSCDQSPPDTSVSSSTLRPSCRFGIRCYRVNPAHRLAEAHPGDSDYRRPDYPAPPLGTPDCPFGNNCYRRNPVHFQSYSHPPDFNSTQNIKNRLRQRRNLKRNSNVADSSGSDAENPFSGDSETDYNPATDTDEDDAEDELEFDSQRVNCDNYD